MKHALPGRKKYTWVVSKYPKVVVTKSPLILARMGSLTGYHKCVNLNRANSVIFNKTWRWYFLPLLLDLLRAERKPPVSLRELSFTPTSAAEAVTICLEIAALCNSFIPCNWQFLQRHRDKFVIPDKSVFWTASLFRSPTCSPYLSPVSCEML